MLYEVVCIWYVDVVRFILENGGDVNKRDEYGWIFLYVVVVVDYFEMVEFFVSSKG